MKEPFDIWWEENMGGFGVSDELKKLLAKAFTGGMEASSGMTSVPIRKMSYTELKHHIGKGGFDPHHIGEPEIVAIWPLPPSMAKDRIHPTGIAYPASPTEKLKSFMGDVAWGDEPKSAPLSKTMYDPSSDTWHTRTVGSDSHYVGGGGGFLTTSTVGAEAWNKAEMYDDMSREERDREMTRIADLIRAKIDERVLDKVRESVRMTTGGMPTRRVEYKLDEYQNEHIIAHRDFVESMSYPKNILTDEQRKTIAMKKKEMSDRISKLAKKHKARK